MQKQNSRVEAPLLLIFTQIYKLLLFAYPADFRNEYGRLMVQIFRDEVRPLLQNGDTAGFVRYLLKALFDFIKTVIFEHLENSFNLIFDGGQMSYHDSVEALSDNAEELELLYHSALKSGQKSAFEQAINDSYQSTPGNLLLAAWFHRINYAARQARRFVVDWSWAAPLAVLAGLAYWWLSDESRMIKSINRYGTEIDYLPSVLIWAAPVTAVCLLLYFKLVGDRSWKVFAIAGALPLVAATAVQLMYPMMEPTYQQQYLTLAVFHIILLSWANVAGFFLYENGDPKSRLDFLMKSLEVIVVGGICVGVLLAFSGITISLFAALNIEFPDYLLRLIFGGGIGAISIVVPAVLYDATSTPSDQQLAPGFARLVGAIMQILLPLTFVVLVAYICFIPANFNAPFYNRGVLITYNVMLFAIVGLLLGATAMRPQEMPPQRELWYRRLMIGVASLALLVGLYALWAILSRTLNDELTPNRLTMIGWNIINIVLLLILLFMQWRGDKQRWIDWLYRTFSVGMNIYAVWAIVVIFTIPWLLMRSG